MRVTGWADGRPAFDYTVNAALGFPFQTGPVDLPPDQPVNSALPAWDFITGSYAAAALLAAHRQRQETGRGAEVHIPLGNVGLAVAGQLGQIAEAVSGAPDRGRFGNAVYGTFGRDFATRDGRRVMITAITPPQWRDLVDRLGVGTQVMAVEQALSVDFSTDGAARFEHRARLFPIFEDAIERFELCDLEKLFDGSRVCWGAYRRVSETIRDPKLISEFNPMFRNITHPSGLT